MESDFWSTSLNQLIPQIQDKKSFQQFEIVEILSIRPYQLRFWESEFDVLSPEHSAHGSYYSERDLKILLRIKKYLIEDQLTVEKAKALLDIELNTFEKELTDVAMKDSISLQENQLELSHSLDVDGQMNSLFEEMSMETFKQVEEVPVRKIRSDAEKVAIIKDTVQRLREKLKNWRG